MDMAKMGALIAERRREKGLTQEQLGEKLGVTNKTVSRWENGNYAPDLDLLCLLAETLDIDVRDLLYGERSAKPAQETVQNKAESAFSLEEKREYYRKKWQREHVGIYCGAVVVVAAYIVFCLLLEETRLLPLVTVVALFCRGMLRNSMMTYVEQKVYDGKSAVR